VLFAQDLSVCYGKGYTLKPDAFATGATSYTWYEDGNPLADENASSLTIEAGTKAAGDYAYVRMAANEECFEGVPSNTFTVRVLPAGAVNQAPDATCGCATGLTAINGYCRDLAADGAVHLASCGFNLEVKSALIAVANFSVANLNCPSGWRPATYDELKCIHANANYAGFSGNKFIATTTTGTSGWHHNYGCCAAGASHLVYNPTQAAWCNAGDGRDNTCNKVDGIGSYYHFRDDACLTGNPASGCLGIVSQCVR
jgi:hypothetical protein